MKRSLQRTLCLLLILALCLGLAGCGKKKSDLPSEEPEASPPVPAEDQMLEVKLSLSNLDQYFEYKEYTNCVKDDNGNTTSVQVSYGLALRSGYIAANDPEHPDTMSLSFTAEGVVRSGDFTVDFNTLQYTGTVADEKTEQIQEDLKFWPQGDRTTLWTFGNYGSSYIIFLRNFTVTRFSGTVHLLRGYRPVED